MRTALLVTDSTWVINDVRSALAVDPWDIEATGDPRAAASRVEETHPDVVLIDMQVGSMGGMAIIRSIRAALQNQTLPRMVLLLDRSADSFLARRALADASVLKPFGAAALRAAVDPAGVASHRTDEEE